MVNNALDSTRKSNDMTLSDYLITLYNNQNSPSTFATASAVGGDQSAFFMFL